MKFKLQRYRDFIGIEVSAINLSGPSILVYKLLSHLKHLKINYGAPLNFKHTRGIPYAPGHIYMQAQITAD